MPELRTIIIATIASLSTAWAAWSASSFSSYLQAVSSDRYKVVTFQQRKAERFELRAGDCHWEGKDSSDCRTGRERVEQRSQTYDALDKTVCYSYGLLLPAGYGEMRPKSILGQWHDMENGDTVSLRYMQGSMWLSQNIRGNEVRHIPIPFRKGVWNDFTFRLKPSHSDGEIKIWLNGRRVVNIENVRTLSGNLPKWYFKYGIYRSHLAGVEKRPTQIAYYSGVKRFTGAKCEGL